MSEVSLDKTLAFNKHLRALSAAGVRFDLGDQSRTILEILEHADKNLALRASLNQSMTEALSEDQELPTIYRNAVQSGLSSGNPTSVLDSLSRIPWTGQQIRRVLGYSFVQPLILFAIAFGGFIVLCATFVPTASEIYNQLQREPHWSIRFLQLARNSMPIWGLLVPLLVLLLIWRWCRVAAIPAIGLPSRVRFSRAIGYANFSDQLRAMVQSKVSLPESLRLAGSMGGRQELAIAAEALADAAERDITLASDDQRLNGLPPLLRWTLTTELGSQSLPDILHFAAKTYRKKAQSQVTFWQTAWPVFFGALIGGAIVLFFGLCLFGPYVNLLKDLS